MKLPWSINEYFANEGNQKTIAGLRDAGVQLWQELAPVDESAQPWKGRTFVVTGALSSMTRREAESKIKALGWHYLFVRLQQDLSTGSGGVSREQTSHG